MNPEAAQSKPTTAKKAPKAATWVWAEDLIPEGANAARAREEAEPLGAVPVSRGVATTLTFLATVVNAKAVAEVGTGTGVSGLALFAGMAEDGILTSVDIEPEHQAVAREVFTAHGIRSQRFRLIAGAALTVLPKLTEGAYDLVFIDGDKLEYPEYVEQSVRLLRPGGVLALDNAFRGGQVADDSDHEDETSATREAIALVTENEQLVPSLLPVGDGLLVAVKR